MILVLLGIVIGVAGTIAVSAYVADKLAAKIP